LSPPGFVPHGSTDWSQQYGPASSSDGQTKLLTGSIPGGQTVRAVDFGMNVAR
jgi:hypothetical protein